MGKEVLCVVEPSHLIQIAIQKDLQSLQLLKETANLLLVEPVKCWEHTYILLVSCVAYTNAQAI